MAFFLIPGPSVYALTKKKEDSPDKSEELANVPIYLIYANILNSLIWLLYGLKVADYGVLIWYNILGIALNVFYLFFYWFNFFMESKIKFIAVVGSNILVTVAIFLGNHIIINKP